MLTLKDRLEVIANNPLHQFIGMEQLQSHEGEGQIELPIGASVINPNGKLHGGIIYAISDVCAYIALLSLLNDNQDAVTHDIHVSVMRAASSGETITFKAKVMKLGKTLAFIRTQAYRQNDLIAEATVTKSILTR